MDDDDLLILGNVGVLLTPLALVMSRQLALHPHVTHLSIHNASDYSVYSVDPRSVHVVSECGGRRPRVDVCEAR